MSLITNDNNDNQNNEFIAAPKGTSPFPFVKKSRTLSKRNPTIVFTIPTDICHLLQIQPDDHFRMYCEVEHGRIIMQKLPESESRQLLEEEQRRRQENMQQRELKEQQQQHQQQKRQNS